MGKSVSKKVAISLIGVLTCLSLSVFVGNYKTEGQMALHQAPSTNHHVHVDIIH